MRLVRAPGRAGRLHDELTRSNQNGWGSIFVTRPPGRRMVADVGEVKLIVTTP
jgi:hypothetical protein